MRLRAVTAGAVTAMILLVALTTLALYILATQYSQYSVALSRLAEKSVKPQLAITRIHYYIDPEKPSPYLNLTVEIVNNGPVPVYVDSATLLYTSASNEKHPYGTTVYVRRWLPVGKTITVTFNVSTLAFQEMSTIRVQLATDRGVQTLAYPLTDSYIILNIHLPYDTLAIAKYLPELGQAALRSLQGTVEIDGFTYYFDTSYAPQCTGDILYALNNTVYTYCYKQGTTDDPIGVLVFAARVKPGQHRYRVEATFNAIRVIPALNETMWSKLKAGALGIEDVIRAVYSAWYSETDKWIAPVTVADYGEFSVSPGDAETVNVYLRHVPELAPPPAKAAASSWGSYELDFTGLAWLFPGNLPAQCRVECNPPGFIPLSMVTGVNVTGDESSTSYGVSGTPQLYVDIQEALYAIKEALAISTSNAEYGYFVSVGDMEDGRVTGGTPTGIAFAIDKTGYFTVTINLPELPYSKTGWLLIIPLYIRNYGKSVIYNVTVHVWTTNTHKELTVEAKSFDGWSDRPVVFTLTSGDSGSPIKIILTGYAEVASFTIGPQFSIAIKRPVIVIPRILLISKPASMLHIVMVPWSAGGANKLVYGVIEIHEDGSYTVKGPDWQSWWFAKPPDDITIRVRYENCRVVDCCPELASPPEYCKCPDFVPSPTSDIRFAFEELWEGAVFTYASAIPGPGVGAEFDIVAANAPEEVLQLGEDTLTVIYPTNITLRTSYPITHHNCPYPSTTHEVEIHEILRSSIVGYGDPIYYKIANSVNLPPSSLYPSTSSTPRYYSNVKTLYVTKPTAGILLDTSQTFTRDWVKVAAMELYNTVTLILGDVTGGVSTRLVAHTDAGDVYAVLTNALAPTFEVKPSSIIIGGATYFGYAFPGHVGELAQDTVVQVIVPGPGYYTLMVEYRGVTVGVGEYEARLDPATGKYYVNVPASSLAKALYLAYLSATGQAPSEANEWLYYRFLLPLLSPNEDAHLLILWG